MMRRALICGLGVWLVGLTHLKAFGDVGDKGLPAKTIVPFAENKGQWASRILFRSELAGGAVFIERDGWVYSFWDDAPLKTYFGRWHSKNFNPNDEKNGFVLKGHSFRMRFAGSSLCRPAGQQTTGGYYNYFIGNDRSKWASGALLYESVFYKDIYPNTDVRLYKVDLGMKYDIILHPGAQPETVRMHYSGADSLWLSNGKFYIKTSVNTVVEQQPYAYQRIHDAIVPVACDFTLEGKELGFAIRGKYDQRHDLVIDPLLIFSTYSGSTADNFGHTATYDSKGHLYAGGITSTNLGGDYPTDSGSFQKTFGGGTSFFPCDISISKYSTNGDSLLFATYLGGSGNDYPHSLVCDYNDDLVVLGTTFSRYFPVTATAYDTSYNASGDIIVTKFSLDGKQLLGSTFLGGTGLDGQNADWQPGEVNACPLAPNYADAYRGDIVFDDNNDYYIATCTRSSNFPVTANALQGTFGGIQDGVIVKFNTDLSQLLMSTYYGGNGSDAFYSVRLNRDQELFIGGGTNSPDFKTDTAAAQPNFQGGTADGVVVHLNHEGDTLIGSTYVGTAKYDQIYFIDVDRKSNVYMAGQTTGNIPVFPPTVYNNPNGGQFLIKANKKLSNIIFSTVFGAGTPDTPDISPSAFVVDNCENIYLSGWGGSIETGHNTSLLPITANAIQPVSDGRDFYIVVFGKNADSLLYATYYGGNLTGDHVDGGTSRFDKRGIIYQSVCSSCPNDFNLSSFDDFPVSSNAVFKTNPSPRCSNASFKMDLKIKNFLDANFIPTPTKGCAPLQVTFNNKSVGGTSILWEFGDGDTSTLLNPTHTYKTGGIYTARLIISDTSTCTISDTIQKTIRVQPSPVAGFNIKLDECKGDVSFENTSLGVLNLVWDFGDGAKDSVNVNPTHTYTENGKYKVTLLVNKGFECPDSISKMVNMSGDSIKPVFIANVFTPNEDEINDGWYIKGLDPRCDKIELYIYNRWGELMFKTTDIQEKWYGTNSRNSLEAPSGTYYFVLTITRKNGSVVQKAGAIKLIRDPR